MPEVPDLFVVADPMRLRQVLLNLLSNAVEVQPRRGEIAIVVVDTPRPEERRAGTGGNGAASGCATPGVGSAADRLDRLFVPFDRLGAETTGTPGAGLGLALTKGLIESMGGAMGVETTVTSGARSGSTFRSRSRAKAPTARARRGLSLGRARPRGRVTVVVIDDNEANLDLLRRVLALRPHVNVVFARDGEEGLARCTADPSGSRAARPAPPRGSAGGRCSGG